MKLFYVLGVLGVSAFLAGCKPNYDAPCRDRAVKVTNAFSAQQLALYPYSQLDTVVFVTTILDTLTFVTQSFTSFETYKPSIVIGNPECPADVDAFKAVQSVLKDSINQQAFGCTMWRANDSTEYTIQGVVYNFGIQQLADSVSGYADSVVLPTRTFYNVHSFVNTIGDTIIVNKTNGLIRFKQAGQYYNQLKFNNK
jgi:hypothetical protein